MPHPKQKKPLVQKLAEQYIAELHISALNPSGEPWTPKGLYEGYADMIHSRTSRLSPAQLGAIAARGKGLRSHATKRGQTPLYLAHDSEWLDATRSGRSLLREIAVTAIIAAMFDILRARETTDAPDGRSP